MRMDKIDLAEELFVINPIWKIEETTWMDICYARLTGKNVSSLESLSYREIQDKENDFYSRRKGWLRNSWKWLSIMIIWIKGILCLFLIKVIPFMIHGSGKICRASRSHGTCMKTLKQV